MASNCRPDAKWPCSRSSSSWHANSLCSSLTAHSSNMTAAPLVPDLPYVRCSQRSIDISFDFSADGVQTVEIDGVMTERNDQVVSGHGGSSHNARKAGLCCASIIARSAGSRIFNRDLPILSRSITVSPDLALPHIQLSHVSLKTKEVKTMTDASTRRALGSVTSANVLKQSGIKVVA